MAPGTGCCSNYRVRRPSVTRRYADRVRPLATLLSPLINRLLYPGAETSQSAQEPDVELMVGGIALRGWEVNPGQDRALVYYGGNGEAPGKIPDLAVRRRERTPTPTGPPET